MDNFLDLKQHEMVTRFSGFSIKTISDKTQGGELLDTRVYVLDPLHPEREVFICTIAGNTAPAGSGFHVLGAGELLLTHSIVAANSGGEAMACGENASAMLSCCDVFGNAGGDSLCGSYSQNLFTDPLFCDLDAGDYTLALESPCAPDSNSCAVLIGALDVTCSFTPVEETTWGRLKDRYRRE